MRVSLRCLRGRRAGSVEAGPEALVPRTPEGRWGFDPQPAPEADLRTALDELAAAYSAHGLATSVEVADGRRLAPERERVLVRVVQVALRNAARRGAASRVAISLRPAGDRLCLEVADDGVGYDGAVLADGLPSEPADAPAVEDLVRDAGGELRIDSRPAAGTTVHVEVPA